MIAFANNISKKLFQSKDSFDEYIDHARQKCKELKENALLVEEDDHIYSIETTQEALGLDSELIDSLLEDYVVQVIKAVPQFHQMIKQLRKDIKQGRDTDFTPLHDLAHKNLGVARNLRIKDAQKILHFIMTSSDLDKIERCLEYLEACAILLKPKAAYEVYSS